MVGRAAGVTFASANASTKVSLTISFTASEVALSPNCLRKIDKGTLPFLKPSMATCEAIFCKTASVFCLKISAGNLTVNDLLRPSNVSSEVFIYYKSDIVLKKE